MVNANLPKDICEVEKLKMAQIGTQYQIIGHGFSKHQFHASLNQTLRKQ